MTPFVRSAYNYDMDQASEDSGLECKDPSLAQQQFKEEADINTLVERFHLTGEVPQLRVDQIPQEVNYEGIFDFQSAMNVVRAAQETFNSLPHPIKTRFQNDPQKFHDFFLDDDNRLEAEKLGLVAKPPLEEPPAPTAQAPTTPPA